jgi:hypothetical protein
MRSMAFRDLELGLHSTPKEEIFPHIYRMSLEKEMRHATKSFGASGTRHFPFPPTRARRREEPSNLEAGDRILR